MNRLFWYIYRIPVPAVLPLIAAIVLIWGFAMRLLLRKSLKAVRIINCAAVLAALVGIFYITVFRNDPGKQELILMPFQSFVEAKEQKEMYREMIMNVFLFFPLGLTAPFALLPARGKQGKANRFPLRYAAMTVGAAAVLSVSIEIFQYFFALGRCETDDVLCNSFGAFLGALSYLLVSVNRRRESG